MCVLQLDTEAADILNELQMKLSTYLDNFSTVFAKRYTHTHTHTIGGAGIAEVSSSNFSSSPPSFQARINGCMRQMAEILYQIKGPPNHNTAEADADTMLRPLMEFLDGK